MADHQKPDEKRPGEKPEGTMHYNPVGMAGKKIDPQEQPQPKTGGANQPKAD